MRLCTYITVLILVLSSSEQQMELVINIKWNTSKKQNSFYNFWYHDKQNIKMSQLFFLLNADGSILSTSLEAIRSW